MTNRIWVPEGLGEVYCDKAYQAFSDDEKEGLVAYERVQTKRCSYCDHYAAHGSWKCDMCGRQGADVPVQTRQPVDPDGCEHGTPWHEWCQMCAPSAPFKGKISADSKREPPGHVTTGDVRLELGWTQEECDEADAVGEGQKND